MKKALLLGIALLMISSVALAQPLGYIGLFADELHSTWCVDPGIYTPFEMWIFCLPGELGQICAEFRISYPANLIQSTVTSNDAIISVALGDLASGISVCYIYCQYDWHWNYHQMLLMTSAEQTICEIVDHPEAGCVQFTNCNPEGYELEACTILCPLWLNVPPEDCPDAVEASSWGAIKGMFND